MNETMIEISNIRKSYGNKEVLNVHELRIQRGACFGLVGNNGAGKTTMFRALLDLIPLDEGEVKMAGVPVHTDESWKSFTGSFLDEGFLIDFLRPEEFFYFIGSTHGMSKQAVDEQLETFKPIFKDEVLGHRRFIRDLSKGNQKKVGIAAAFLGQPQIVILDEPFANLDPSSQFQLRELIRKLGPEQGITTLVSSHDLGHVTEISSRIVILNQGQIMKDMATNAETLKELEAVFQSM